MGEGSRSESQFWLCEPALPGSLSLRAHHQNIPRSVEEGRRGERAWKALENCKSGSNVKAEKSLRISDGFPFPPTDNGKSRRGRGRSPSQLIQRTGCPSHSSRAFPHVLLWVGTTVLGSVAEAYILGGAGQQADPATPAGGSAWGK